MSGNGVSAFGRYVRPSADHGQDARAAEGANGPNQVGRILAIADDLTGAAEIAGIGWRCGLPARVARQPMRQSAAGLTVLDTDSRLLNAAESARTVEELLNGVSAADFQRAYKKTDSVLRGHIVDELAAAMSALKLKAALLVAQNPSRGRIIRDGRYLIDGVPLDRTTFGQDPDHPARTADVAALLGGLVRCIAPGQPLLDGINVGEAWTVEHVRQWAGRVEGSILPAGGADFFTAILEHRGLSACRAAVQRLEEPVLFACGSASSHSRELAADAQRRGMPICPMPDAVFAGGTTDRWAEDVAYALKHAGRALMTIPQPVDRSPGASQRIQSAMAAAVLRVLEDCAVANLLLEGGATASAVCRRMAWHELDVIGELSPGVVQMQSAGGQRLVLKPGSYPWPECVWRD